MLPHKIVCFITRSIDYRQQLAFEGYEDVVVVDPPSDKVLKDYYTDVFRACRQHQPLVVVLDLAPGWYHRLLIKFERLSPQTIFVCPHKEYDSENSFDADRYIWSGRWQRLRLEGGSITRSFWSPDALLRERAETANAGERRANATIGGAGEG